MTTQSPMRRSQGAASSVRAFLEFAALLTLYGLLRTLPRHLSRALGALIAAIAFRLLKRLRETGLQNLRMVFPSRTEAERTSMLQREYRHLGYLLAEFCRMSLYTKESAGRFIEYDGLEHYLVARDAGRGVLVLTGHLGAWELSSFYHSLMGYPMGLVIRRLDNSLVDRFVNRIRCLHGNRVIHKDDFARGLITSMRAGETVGILMDSNMTPPQGVFVPFFGRLACTASGMARVALKTGAAVLPGFLLWEDSKQKYVLRFGPRIELVDSGDAEQDAATNTANFTAILEEYVRRYPDQWLWMHRRWKTRPPGEKGIY